MSGITPSFEESLRGRRAWRATGWPGASSFWRRAILAAIVTCGGICGALGADDVPAGDGPGPRGGCEAPPVQTLDPASGYFSRASVAYVRDDASNTLVLKDAEPTPTLNSSQMRLVPITTVSASDGAVSTIIVGDRTLSPRCALGPYVFACGYSTKGGMNDARWLGVYRTADGVNWTRVDTNNPSSKSTFSPTMLFALPAQNVLIAGVDEPYYHWYWSADAGATWAPCHLDGDQEFDFTHDLIAANPWPFHQRSSGTTILGQYGTNDVRLYRTTDGVEWTTVCSDTTPRPYHPASRHLHAVGYHAGCFGGAGRWIACFGDRDNTHMRVSDDDGLTWTILVDYAVDPWARPTALLDIGDPEFILAGSDEASCVGLLSVVDGTTQRDAWNLGDRRSNNNIVLFMVEHDGVYYACLTDSSRTKPSDRTRICIVVSTDGIHWNVYHRFPDTVGTARWCGGEAGGKLWFMVSQQEAFADGPLLDRAFSISPARVTNGMGLLLEPGTTNLLTDSGTNYSDQETDANWACNSGDMVRTLESAGSYQGTGHLKFTHTVPASSLDVRADCRNSSLTPGKVLQATGHVRGICGRWWWSARYYSARGGGWCSAMTEAPGYKGDTSTWSEFISPPLAIDPQHTDATSFQLYMAQNNQNTFSAADELDIDAMQLEEVPGTTWQNADTPRADELLTHEVDAGAPWMNVLTIFPRNPSRWLAACAPLYIQSWILNASKYATLYYDPSDSRFTLEYYEGRTRPRLVFTLKSAPQEWFESYAPIRISVRAAESVTRLTIRNAGDVSVVQVNQPMTALLCATLTVQNGRLDAMDGTHQLPCILGDNLLYAGSDGGYENGEYTLDQSDTDDAHSVNGGDLNCDGAVDFNDIDPFVTALISKDDYAAQYPDCNYLNGDINRDGAVDFNDIDAFVECLVHGGCP